MEPRPRTRTHNHYLCLYVYLNQYLVWMTKEANDPVSMHGSTATRVDKQTIEKVAPHTSIIVISTLTISYHNNMRERSQCQFCVNSVLDGGLVDVRGHHDVKSTYLLMHQPWWCEQLVTHGCCRWYPLQLLDSVRITSFVCTHKRCIIVSFWPRKCILSPLNGDGIPWF